MDIAGSTGEDRTQPRLSVVIPAYNEARRLVRTLDATAVFLEARSEPYEILTVDDGSVDETNACAENWSSNRPLRFGKLKALRYAHNRGKGYAVKYGVLRATGNRILIMDADLATPIEELSKLESALTSGSGALQVAIGSRPLPESELVVRQPWYRELAGRAFNGIVQLAATPGIHDTQCGFKLMTIECARDVFPRVILDGFSYDVETLFLARRLGYGIAEVPVRWAHQEGAAAFSSPTAYLRQGLRMVMDLVRIRWAHKQVRRSRGSVASMSTPSHPRA